MPACFRIHQIDAHGQLLFCAMELNRIDLDDTKSMPAGGSALLSANFDVMGDVNFKKARARLK